MSGFGAARFWWIRHAPSDARGLCGWTDAPAVLFDKPALARLAARLPEAPMVTSDLRRAVETARALRGPRRRLPPMPELREQNFGAWEGAAYDDPRIAPLWENPAEVRPEGGESFVDLCARVGPAALSLAERTREGDLICVAHAGAIRAALAYALDLAPQGALAFEIAPLSLTRIDWIPSARAWRVVSVNERA